MAQIYIYGELFNNTVDGHVAEVAQIYDSTYNQTQAALNNQFMGAVSGVNNTSYLVCETTGSTKQKSVTLPGYQISSCTRLLIKMVHKNTQDEEVVLKIDTTLAKPLYYKGAVVTSSNTWEDGEVVDVYYDSTLDAFCCNASSADSVFASGEKLSTVGIDNSLSPNSPNLVRSSALFPIIGDGNWAVVESGEVGVTPGYIRFNIAFPTGRTYKVRASYSGVEQVIFYPYHGKGDDTVNMPLPDGTDVNFTPTEDLKNVYVYVGQILDSESTVTLSVAIDTTISTLEATIVTLQNQILELQQQVFPLTVTLSNNISGSIVEWQGEPISSRVTWTASKSGKAMNLSSVVLKKNTVEVRTWENPNVTTDFYNDTTSSLGRVSYSVAVTESGRTSTASSSFNIVLPSYIGFADKTLTLAEMLSGNKLNKKLMDQSHSGVLKGTYNNQTYGNYLIIAVPSSTTISYIQSGMFEMPMDYEHVRTESITIGGEQYSYKIYNNDSGLQTGNVEITDYTISF